MPQRSGLIRVAHLAGGPTASDPEGLKRVCGIQRMAALTTEDTPAQHYLSADEINYLRSEISHEEAVQACADVGIVGVGADSTLEALRSRLCVHYEVTAVAPPVPSIPVPGAVDPPGSTPVTAEVQRVPQPEPEPQTEPVLNRRVILRQGWLEKKGGDTHIDRDNVLRKDRHYGKGGRRNWKQRYFILYSDGELAYFSSADGNPGQQGGAEPKGRLLLVGQGNPCRWHLRDGAEKFLLSLPGVPGADRKALMLRHANEAERHAWMEVTRVFGADVGPLLYEKEERGVAERAIKALKPKQSPAASLTTNEAVVLFSFAPQSEGDLELIVGDRIVIVHSVGDWWTGHVAGRPEIVGIFPCTFVERGKKIPTVGAAPVAIGLSGQLRTVVRQGWLEKKGGDTHIDRDNVLHKDRHYGKGGRRNWKQRYFILYSDGELAYFSSADGNPGQQGGAEPKVQLRVAAASGAAASWHLRDDTDEFLLSLPGAVAEDRKALFLRHSDENERQAWIQSTVHFGSTVGPLLIEKHERGVAENVVRRVRSRLSSGRGQRSAAASLTTDQALVLFEFQPQQSGDLSLSVGDTVVLLDMSGDWWTGHIESRPDVVGVFPCTFVERGRVPVGDRSSFSNRLPLPPVTAFADVSATQAQPPPSAVITDCNAPPSIVPVFRPAAMPPLHDVNAVRFARFDDDGDGFLDIREVSVLVQEMGLHADPEWIAELIAKYDLDLDKQLSKSEFISCYEFLEAHVQASMEPA